MTNYKVYDRNSNLTKVTDGNGVETGYAYDALNRLSTYMDGNGGETAYTYDALSRLTAITTPEGLKETYTYDKVGNILSVTDGLDQTTRYTYDDLYRLVRRKSPMGAVENYSYDSHDIVTSVTDALGNKTSYEVNVNGQVTTRTEANGGQYTYTYDAVQRLTSITTPLGYETAFAYSMGDDILTESDSLGRIAYYEYDIMHRLIKVIDPEGGVSTFDYDERGNQSKVTNALGYSYSFAYDKVDRLTTVTDPEEKATKLVYDKVGNVTAVTTPGERTTQYSYDNNYNTVSVTDPMGYVYGYSYDKDDRLTGTVDPMAQTTGYTYDSANRLTAYTDKMGLTESYLYDAHGNVLEKTATDGLITTYTYDLKDRLTSVTDPMGSTAYYTWDEMNNLTGVVDYLGRGTTYTYDLEGNLTSITDAAGRTETMTYDAASRITSYTSNGGNRITYDYDKLDNLVEKAYQNAQGETTAEPVAYAYNALGQRVNLYDSTGDTEYTYDGLGRITSVTTYRTETESGDTVGYTYDEADNLSAITYPDGTQVCYEYDLNDNLIKVIDREGSETTYVYDAINRVTEIRRPNGISTYNTYNARNQITELTNICDDCQWVVSSYSYTYDNRGYIVAETAIESLAGYAYDDKHDGKHTDGRHDDLYPHGTKHDKHNKDATFAYQIVQTDRTFTYDDAGKLLSSTETEDNYGTYTYTYEYDLMGNRIAMTKTAEDGTVAEWHKYEYNESNQLVSEELYDGKKTTSLRYEYDADGNRISETGKIGTDKVQLTYEYTVENRLEAVYDADELLTAMAYDGDGNRVFQLNYNLHTDDDWKGNSGNGNGSNKDNAGSGNSLSSDVSADDSASDEDSDSSTGDSTDNDSSSNNGNNKNKTNNGNSGNSSANNGKGGNGKKNGNTKKNSNSTETQESESADADTSTDGTTGEKENTDSTVGEAEDSVSTDSSADSSTTTDTGNVETESSTGNGNATNAEENNSQNQCGILFPADDEVSDTEQSLIDKIKTTGKQKNYELIEYINDVNREYAEVLVEQNINGKLDTAYVYGNDRLSLDRFDGSKGYYLYDPRGSVTGITNEEGQLYQSYRYDAYGNITFGAPQYENEYTYNGESYNPNIESQYLRARYYDVVNGNFLTEDSYLGSIHEPLTLNRYNYCISSPLNYIDPSGCWVDSDISRAVLNNPSISQEDKGKEISKRVQLYFALETLGDENATIDYVLQYDYSQESYLKNVMNAAVLFRAYSLCSDEVSEEFKRYYEKNGYVPLEDYLISEDVLVNIGWKGDISPVDLYTMNMMLEEYEINTTERMRHFFTQILIESGNGMYNREGEYLLQPPYNYSQEEYEEYYNNKSRYSYKDRGVGYIQTTFTYNHQAFATYLLMLDYPELGIDFLSPQSNSAKEIENNYQKALDKAEDNGIDISCYEDIVDKGTDYIAENYSWDISGYWWMDNKENDNVDEFQPGNKYEVDKVTDDVNFHLGRESRDKRIEKYAQIMNYIQ